MPCPKTGMSRKRDVNRKRPKIISFKTSMTSEKQVSGLGPQSCQQEGLSRFRDDKHKPDQETVAASERMSRERSVKDKEFQEITQSTAVTTKRSNVVLLFFIGFRIPPCWKLPSLGSAGMYVYIYISILTIEYYRYVQSICIHFLHPSAQEESNNHRSYREECSAKV